MTNENNMNEKEQEIFNQELSQDELDAITGGTDRDAYNCIQSWIRDIYGNRELNIYNFPNCAATVEDGSHCDTNDACWTFAVDYKNMKECRKAWR